MECLCYVSYVYIMLCHCLGVCHGVGDRIGIHVPTLHCR